MQRIAWRRWSLLVVVMFVAACSLQLVGCGGDDSSTGATEGDASADGARPPPLDGGAKDAASADGSTSDAATDSGGRDSGAADTSTTDANAAGDAGDAGNVGDAATDASNVGDAATDASASDAAGTDGAVVDASADAADVDAGGADASNGDAGGDAAGATYAIGGTLSGLAAGVSVVLQDNSGDDLTLSANGAFAFATQLATGVSYAVTVSTQPSGPTQTCTVTNGFGTVAASSVTSVAVVCSTDAFSIGGTLSGLAPSASVVLQANGGDNLTLSANGSFTFATPIASGASYGVTVLTQPANPSQTCTVSNGGGTVGASAVGSVSVTCVTNSFTVGGTVASLGGTIVLQNNGGGDLSISANGAFTFATPLLSGSPYDVTILTQPSGQTCSVSGGSGTVGAGNVTSVTVNCAVNTYTIGGTISGLIGTVVLADNGGDSLAVNANGTFAFAAPIASGAPYAVSIVGQPAGQTCTISNGVGNVAAANVTSVVVSCVTNTYTVGGTLGGLASGASVVLQMNGGDNLTLNGNGSFTFATSLPSGASYAVTVLTPPSSPSQACTVSGGTGILSANVTSVSVSCVTNTFTVGGTVSGLTSSIVLRNNGGDDLTVAADGSFTFATPVPSGGSYQVTIFTQPAGQTCSVLGGTGTVVAGNVTGVKVDCSPNMYGIGGTIAGLTGTVVLADNGSDTLTLNANGSFAFGTSIASGSPYAVTVVVQPTGQTCSVTNGAGTVSTADVTSVSVTCVTQKYSIGGTLSGLGGGTTITLQDNGGDNLLVNANGTFTFSTPIPYGASYNVTILTQPAGQACAVSGASGSVGSGNVTSVVVNCANNTFTVGGTVSGLTGSLTLQNNGGDNLSLSANGTFAFSTPIATGATYSVSVLAQPFGELCTVTNGAGTMGSANVASVTVACVAKTYTIGGTISGLTGPVILTLNGGSSLNVSSSGSFTFATPLPNGSSYNVAVKQQPNGQWCSVTNGAGTVSSANVTNVVVTCASGYYFVGGVATGVAGGTLVIQNNGGDTLTLGANGSYAFATPLSQGSTYNVTVLTPPAGKTCTVSNGSGTIGTSNVSNAFVNCH